MFQVTPQMRVVVAVEPVDGRKGIDGLAQFCRQKLQENPFSGHLFIFRNRRGTTLILLNYDLCAATSYGETLRARAHPCGSRPFDST